MKIRVLSDLHLECDEPDVIPHAAADLIVLAGDIPPDVSAQEDVHLPPVLLGLGTGDGWYTASKFEQDLKYLNAVTDVTTCVFDGGHEWSDPFRTAAAEYLRGLTG